MTAASASMREMLETLVRGMVDDPSGVAVSEIEKAQVTVLELRVAPRDLGKVIGREGRTARALRSLLAVAGEKLQRRFVLQILE